MKKGFFVVIDGIDGAGKTLQTEILLKRLRKEGFKSSTLDFPRYYDNFFGKMTGQYLKGDFGDTDPKLASVLYALDRWQSKEKIEKELKSGKVFVCNRYASANMIHQGGRIKGSKNKKDMIKWLYEMEFNIFKIPRPDMVLYLDVPPNIGQKMIDKKEKRKYIEGKKRDIHEADKNHLIDARKQALSLVKENDNWIKINCTKRGEMIAPLEIGELIWKEVKKHI